MEFKDPAVKARVEQADKLTKEIFGNKVYIRGIIEFSNCCRKNCNYCGIRRGNTSVVRYQMSPDEIVAKAEENLKHGIKTIVLQSGEDLSYTKDVLVDIIKRIKALDPECAITLSIGERTEDEYKAFKDAGADRFLLRFETAEKALFESLHPDDDYDYRINTIKILKKLGYEVGSGFMFGIPGEAPDADDQNIALLRELGVAMVGCGPFIPAEGTPMEGSGIPHGGFRYPRRSRAVPGYICQDPACNAGGEHCGSHRSGRRGYGSAEALPFRRCERSDAKHHPS